MLQCLVKSSKARLEGTDSKPPFQLYTTLGKFSNQVTIKEPPPWAQGSNLSKNFADVVEGERRTKHDSGSPWNRRCVQIRPQ